MMGRIGASGQTGRGMTRVTKRAERSRHGMVRARLLALLAVLVTGLLAPGLAACGAERGPAAPGHAAPAAPDASVVRAIEKIDGVRAAEIGVRGLDTDQYSYDLVADMDAGATAEQVAAVLDAMTAWQAGVRDEHTASVHLAAGTTEYDDSWEEGEGPSLVHAGPDREVNLHRAGLFVAADAALDERVVVAGDRRLTHWRVVSRDPLATVRAVAADPVLAAAPGLQVIGRGTTFASAGPLRADWVAAYARAIAHLPQPAGATASVMSFGSPMEGRFPRVDPGRLQIILVLKVPVRDAPALVAQDPDQDPLWPAVRSQLDVLKGRPDGSQLWVWLQYNPIGDDFRRTHDLVDLTLGTPPDERKQPSWNEEAAAYLAR